MTLRITFLGPNTELNDKLVAHVKDLIGNEVVETTVLPNTIRDVIEVTKKDDWSGYDIDWLNLWAASYRGILQQGARDNDLVVSSSCSIDQVVMQASWLADQESHLENSILIANMAGEVNSPDDAMVHRCGSVLQVLLNQAEEDAAEYWDFMYAVLPVDIEVSSASNLVLTQYNEFLKMVPVFASIPRLPDNEMSAMDALTEEVELWKAKLKS